jgi:hypothetical protein
LAAVVVEAGVEVVVEAVLVVLEAQEDPGGPVGESKYLYHPTAAHD